MTDRERIDAQQEAKAQAVRSGDSAARARLWAGLNRYLSAEATHAHHQAHRQAHEQDEQDEQGTGADH